MGACDWSALAAHLPQSTCRFRNRTTNAQQMLAMPFVEVNWNYRRKASRVLWKDIAISDSLQHATGGPQEAIVAPANVNGAKRRTA